jgi:hypothetical protein
MTGAALAACLVATVAATGCAGAAADRDPAPDRESSPTRVGADLPPGCRPAEVARLLDDLFDALNRGDEEAAAALVVDREMLVLLKQPAGGRPLRLTAVIVGFGNGLGQLALSAAGGLMGKGALDCETRKLAAVGLGAHHVRMAPLCGGLRACAQPR